MGNLRKVFLLISKVAWLPQNKEICATVSLWTERINVLRNDRQRKAKKEEMIGKQYRLEH